MIYEEYDNLVKLRAALAERMKEEAEETKSPLEFAQKANAELEKLDRRIVNAREKLFSSNGTYDKVYRLRLVQHLRVEKIALSLHMDQSSVYRILRKIGKVAKK